MTHASIPGDCRPLTAIPLLQAVCLLGGNKGPGQGYLVNGDGRVDSSLRRALR